MVQNFTTKITLTHTHIHMGYMGGIIMYICTYTYISKVYIVQLLNSLIQFIFLR